MLRNWWSVPGPATWIDGVLGSLRAGRSVILQLPDNRPPGLREAFERQIAEIGGAWAWTPLWLSGDREGAENPAHFLWKRLGREAGEGPPTAVKLARSDLMTDHVFWLEGLSKELWPEWARFLESYTHACLERESWDRGLFVACHSGNPGPLPERSVGLSHHALTAVSGHLDMILWTASCLREAGRFDLENHLKITVIAELAGADPVVAEEFVHADLDDLLNPADSLRRLASERGWDSSRSVEPDWAEGTLHYVDGQSRTHSLLLAVSGEAGCQELQRRVWRAQVAVLFPFLEQERVALLARLGPMLRPPATSSYGDAKDIQELELSHILAQVRSRVDKRTRRRLQNLVNARNALAHLETIDASAVRELFQSSDH